MAVTNYSGDAPKRKWWQKIGHSFITCLEAAWAAICCCAPQITGAIVTHEAGAAAGSAATNTAARIDGTVYTTIEGVLERVDDRLNSPVNSDQLIAARQKKYGSVNDTVHNLIDGGAATAQAIIVATSQPDIDKALVEGARQIADAAADNALGLTEAIDARISDGTAKKILADDLAIATGLLTLAPAHDVDELKSSTPSPQAVIRRSTTLTATPKSASNRTASALACATEIFTLAPACDVDELKSTTPSPQAFIRRPLSPSTTPKSYISQTANLAQSVTGTLLLEPTHSTHVVNESSPVKLQTSAVPATPQNTPGTGLRTVSGCASSEQLTLKASSLFNRRTSSGNLTPLKTPQLARRGSDSKTPPPPPPLESPEFDSVHINIEEAKDLRDIHNVQSPRAAANSNVSSANQSHVAQLAAQQPARQTSDPTGGNRLVYLTKLVLGGGFGRS